jgi:hypothetical protein
MCFINNLNKSVMSKYKIRVSIILLLSICLFQYACKDSSFTDIENIEHVENTGDEYDPNDPDEIGYTVDTAEPSQLEERASTFKIMQVITNDSLPIFRPDGSGKKQKYGKRQIVSTTAKTRFFLRGYGFKSQSDSSTVKAYIKNVEQPNINIISWSDTLVTVDFPILTSQLLIEKTFSIKFKIFRANDKAGRTNTTRVRSKSCISSVQAATAIGGSVIVGNTDLPLPTDSYINFRINQYRISFGKSSFQNPSLVRYDSNYIPQVGDVLYYLEDTTKKAVVIEPFFTDNLGNTEMFKIWSGLYRNTADTTGIDIVYIRKDINTNINAPSVRFGGYDLTHLKR